MRAEPKLDVSYVTLYKMYIVLLQEFLYIRNVGRGCCPKQSSTPPPTVDTSDCIKCTLLPFCNLVKLEQVWGRTLENNRHSSCKLIEDVSNDTWICSCIK